MTETRSQIEERLVDTLIGWKIRTDKLSQDTAAARAAVLEAKDLRIWEGKYGSFKEWLAEECGITETWAYSLISSAKTIAAIEDAAQGSPLATPNNLEALRALPEGAVKKLEKLPSSKAAKVALEAILQAEGVPNTKLIAEQIKAQSKRDKTGSHENHPVMIALDNEWVAIQRDLAVVEFTPKEIFGRLRAKAEQAL